jgi:bifunctional non-homologous end joining protein LigD
MRHAASAVVDQGLGALTTCGSMAGAFSRPRPAGVRTVFHPGFVEPCHPTLRPPPTGEQWLREIKFDGYRTQMHLQDGRPAAFTRNGHDWMPRFRSIAETIGRLPAQQLILDREVVVAGRGSGDFGALQADLAAGRSDP